MHEGDVAVDVYGGEVNPSVRLDIGCHALCAYIEETVKFIHINFLRNNYIIF